MGGTGASLRDLPDHVGRLLVGAKAQEDWMAHLAFGGPFGELHLADELGLDPGGVRFVWNLFGDRFRFGDERHEKRMQGFERLAVEAGSGAAYIAPAIALAHGKHKRAEILTRPPRRGEADNDHFLAKRRFDLQPFPRALARVVATAGELRHDAFFAGAGSTLEGGDAR